MIPSPNSQKEGMFNMATKDQYLAAAGKAPDKRTVAEQALVDKGRNMQAVSNRDFEARGRKNP